jgi:hypothetical protein
VVGAERDTMNLDITFCNGERCDRKKACYRFKGMLRERLKDEGREHILEHEQYLSVSEFADDAGNCEEFWPYRFGE